MAGRFPEKDQGGQDKPLSLDGHGTWYDLLEKVVEYFATNAYPMVRIVWHEEVFRVYRSGNINADHDREPSERQRNYIAALEEAFKTVRSPEFRENRRLRREINSELEAFFRRLGIMPLADQLAYLRQLNDTPTESPR